MRHPFLHEADESAPLRSLAASVTAGFTESLRRSSYACVYSAGSWHMLKQV